MQGTPAVVEEIRTRSETFQSGDGGAIESQEQRDKAEQLGPPYHCTAMAWPASVASEVEMVLLRTNCPPRPTPLPCTKRNCEGIHALAEEPRILVGRTTQEHTRVLCQTKAPTGRQHQPPPTTTRS